MKKALCVTGLIAILLLVLLLTGWADFDDAAKKALRDGNNYYAIEQYESALISYERGLAASPEDKTLNFNAAQAAMELGEYEKAAQYYEKAADSVDKYLNAGNIYYAVGNALEETDAKVQFYAKALQIYREGILLYPQNIPLKFNYEFVKALLDEESQSENSDEGDPQESDEESEQSDGQDSNEQNQSDESQDQEGEGEDQSVSQEEDNQDSGEEENSANMQDQGEEDDEEGEDTSSADEEEYDVDMEAVRRILEMLESQEEESLKNNQSVMQGKDGKIDW